MTHEPPRRAWLHSAKVKTLRHHLTSPWRLSFMIVQAKYGSFSRNSYYRHVGTEKNSSNLHHEDRNGGQQLQHWVLDISTRINSKRNQRKASDNTRRELTKETDRTTGAPNRLFVSFCCYLIVLKNRTSCHSKCTLYHRLTAQESGVDFLSDT